MSKPREVRGELLDGRTVSLNGTDWFCRLVERAPEKILLLYCTAGGIKNAEELLDGTFVVTNGEVLTGLDLAGAIETHFASDALATLTSVEEPSAYGQVDHRLRAKTFIEKPGDDRAHSRLIDAVICVLEPGILNMILEGRDVSIEREVFSNCSQWASSAPTFPAPTRHVGTPRSYVAACHDLLSGTVGQGGDFRYTKLSSDARVSMDVKPCLRRSTS